MVAPIPSNSTTFWQHLHCCWRQAVCLAGLMCEIVCFAGVHHVKSAEFCWFNLIKPGQNPGCKMINHDKWIMDPHFSGSIPGSLGARSNLPHLRRVWAIPGARDHRVTRTIGEPWENHRKTPKMDGLFHGKSIYKWMIMDDDWGSPFFGKPPDGKPDFSHGFSYRFTIQWLGVALGNHQDLPEFSRDYDNP